MSRTKSLRSPTKWQNIGAVNLQIKKKQNEAQYDRIEVSQGLKSILVEGRIHDEPTAHRDRCQNAIEEGRRQQIDEETEQVLQHSITTKQRWRVYCREPDSVVIRIVTF